MLAEQLLGMLVGYVDTWLTGRFLPGEAYLAAIGLMSYVMWLIPSLFAAVAIGGTALVARFVGAGDRALALQATNQSMLLALAMSLAVTAGMYWGGERLIALMQLESAAAELALRYLQILVPVIPAIGIEQVGFACLRGAGDTVSSLATMIVVNSVNMLLSFALVTGYGPFPEWGWQGLAVGTTTGHLVGAAIVVLLLAGGRAGLRLRPAGLRPDRALIERLLRVGIPGGVDIVAILLCHFWFVAIVNALGTTAAAAHSLGIRIESLAYLPGAAFQVAASTMCGQSLGAGDPRRAARSVWLALAVGGGVMALGATLLFTAAEPLTVFFLSDGTSEVARLTPPLLRIVSVSIPFLALAMILAGALRGAGDTRWPLVVTIVGFLGVRIPLAYWFAWDAVGLPGGISLAALGWGIAGAWYAMVLDIVIRSLLILARFLHGGWKHVRV